MDLWHIPRATIEERARAIMARRGYKVIRVHELGTGLWVGVTIAGGSYVNLSAETITEG